MKTSENGRFRPSVSVFEVSVFGEIAAKVGCTGQNDGNSGIRSFWPKYHYFWSFGQISPLNTGDLDPIKCANLPRNLVVR